MKSSIPMEKPSEDDNFDNVLEYDVKINFSKLTDVLKSINKSTKENSGDIQFFKETLRQVIEQKENTALTIEHLTREATQNKVKFYIFIISFPFKINMKN